tara:strand:+ start:787 stop:1257 length:471 start_codon:yes stop_codon:yes gene_type:complete
VIKIRKLKKKDSNYFNKLIDDDSANYHEFSCKGWTLHEINNQFNKTTNLSYGVFYRDIMISFIFGDLINIEKISEYEILLIYVSKHYRKKGFGTKLIKAIEENINCIKKIYLEVSINNLEGISFYKKMGFNEINIRKDYYSSKNKKNDAFIMLKNY